MKQHRQTHLEQQVWEAYNCKFCDHRPFLYNISLKKHMQKYHSFAEQLHEPEEILENTDEQSLEILTQKEEIQQDCQQCQNPSL